MYMSAVGNGPEVEILGELEGVRVLLTGLTSTQGVDVARAFADVKARLVVHTSELGPEMTSLVALLSQSASEMKLFTGTVASSAAAVQLAQNAAKAFGGLDVVVNIVSISGAEMASVESEREVEDLVAAKLTAMTHITQVTANRMRVVLSEGSVLNVLMMPKAMNARQSAIACVARSALAAITRGEAKAWAGEAVRINAVGPRVELENSGACLTNEPDLAALALYLASRRGKNLSGHVFDAEALVHTTA
jgi:3-oxoacyl-[acyl-carrier protein] reductase